VTGQEAIGKTVSASGYKKKSLQYENSKTLQLLAQRSEGSSWLEILKTQLSLRPCFQ